MEGAERVLPSSHPHTSRTETFPLPESRDPVGEKGIMASLQPKPFAPLWALRADAGRFLGTLDWVTLDFPVGDTAGRCCSATLARQLEPPATGRKSGCPRLPLQAQQRAVRIQPINARASPALGDRGRIKQLGTKEGRGEGGICQCCEPMRSLPLT